jgi:RNA polymerase sigma-70 factor (ECF subfamily)
MRIDASDAVMLTVADLANLTALFEEHRPRLRAMLHARIDPSLAGRLDADDLLQEAFLRARRSWPRDSASGLSAYAWLYWIARDCLIDAWRYETRAGRDPRREMAWPEQSSVQLGLSLVNTGTSPSQAVARDELRQAVRRALDQLAPADREVLWMRDVDGLPFRDVAVLLGTSENTAMKRYSRASRRFRALWRQSESSAAGGDDPCTIR